MILKSQLEKVIESNKQYFSDNKLHISRQLQLPDKTSQITVISGVRRSGKSTLMKMKYTGKENSLFINFEDPRLEQFEIEDIDKLYDIIREKNVTYLLLDELQNLESWEKLARFFHDRNLKIVITGSNSSMLSKELGTKLTGRYRLFELFPFNYKEFTEYYNFKPNAENFRQHLLKGGFPDYLKEKSDDYLHTLVNNIVIRDVAVRRNIKNEKLLLRLAVYLFSNVGKPFSYNKIAKALEIKSVRTCIDYCNYLSESYLLEFLPQFSWSPKKTQMRPKKVYSIDTGLARVNSLSLQDDWGRLLENYVYLWFRQNGYDLSYWKSEHSECDFIVKSGKNIISAVQVCWELTAENMKREMKGLKEAMKDTNAKNGYFITYQQNETLDKFKVLPVWKL
ncbi:MAG: ATP-binding protein [Bacteroidota bacterium]|nr:ATP-binding protein [Bacteroidota bacterium]